LISQSLSPTIAISLTDSHLVASSLPAGGVAMKRRVLRTLCLAVLLAIGFGVRWVHTDPVIAITEKLAEGSTLNQTSYTSSGAFSIASQAIGICFINSGASTTPSAPTLSGAGATSWTQIATVPYDPSASQKKRVTAFRALGSGGSAASLVADFGGQSQGGVTFVCYEATGTDVGGTNGSGAVLQSATNAADATDPFTVTLGTREAESAVLMFSAVGQSLSMTPESGYTAGTKTGQATPTMQTRAQWLIGGSDATPTWDFSAAANAGGIAMELRRASSGCDGSGTDDYWNCLMNLSMGSGGANIGYQFRSSQELDDWAAADPPTAVTYTSGGNPDAAKLVIEAGQYSLANQVRPEIHKSTGDVLVTWDSWNTPEWYLGRTCSVGATTTQKTFQLSAPAEGNAGRHMEIRQRYTGASYAGGTVAGWNPVTSLTQGTDIATIDVRSYSVMGASGSPMAGQVADFVIKKDTWTRYWALYELNQGSAWSCGMASGNYDLFSLWVADENQAPVRLYDRVAVEADRVTAGACTAGSVLVTPGEVQGLWFEYNSSEGGCTGGASQDRIGYFRNWAALNDANNALFSVSGSSITVGGTELLVKPKP
jgi:hypothetical protein